MDLLIVTGMSGAGKSQAINALEDLGYYCVDNVPPGLLTKFAELSGQSRGSIVRIALVVDARSRTMFADYREGLESLKQLGYDYKTLFLDCNDDVLLRRYKETRRMHPLVTGGAISLDRAIAEERGLLEFARTNADYFVDTSEVSRIQLRSIIVQLFSKGTSGGMAVTCSSFGFKHGIPPDSDLVLDVRCLSNPFYMDELREKTGLDPDVREYVLASRHARELIPRLFELIDFLIPLYIQEGKSQLVISMGCTGGKHRSVVFAELLAEHLRKQGIEPSCYHRHIHLSNK